MTKWQVFCAVALRKMPDLIPRRNLIELKVQEIFNAYEIAMSKYSDHEMQHFEDMKNKEDESVNVIIKETAQDREEQWSKELDKFTPGPYDERLTYVKYLFVRQNFGSDPTPRLLLPQAQYDCENDLDLLSTGRRALRETLNLTNGFTIVSKIPSSVYSYKYPKKVRASAGYDGAKVFFLKANLDRPSRSVLEAIGGVGDKAKSVANGEKGEEAKFVWLTRSEALNRIGCLDYMKSFSRGLLHEDRVDISRVLNIAKSSVYERAQASGRVS